MRLKIKDNRNLIYAFAISIIVFVIDLIIPLGIAFGVLYVTSIIVVVGERKQSILTIAIISTVFTLIDPVLTYTSETTWMMFVNRFISVFAIWVTAIIAIRYKILANINESQKLVTDYEYALDKSAIVAITDQKGIIKYVNDQFCTISKYSEEEIVGKDHRIVNSGYHPKEFIKDLWATIESGRVWKGEIRNKAKDGAIYWVNTTIIPFLDYYGKPYQYVAIRFDITQKKEQELNLKISKAELEDTNRNLEQFAYTVSHDLKSPLNNIEALVNLTEKDLGLESKEVKSESFGLLKKVVGDMKDMISGILTYSRSTMGTTKKEMVNLNKEIKEIIDLNKRDNVSITIGEELPTVHFNKTALLQVFNNLISNAIKYNDKEVCEIVIGFQDDFDKYIISIADNGPGIPEEFQETIFDLFATVDSKRGVESTGIGLAIVKKHIEYAEGEIWLKSDGKEGVGFYFTIRKESPPSI